MPSRSAPEIATDRPRRLDELVDALQSQGSYTFMRAEAFKKAVQLLARRRRLASPWRGFYVIVPVEYRVAGRPQRRGISTLS